MKYNQVFLSSNGQSKLLMDGQFKSACFKISVFNQYGYHTYASFSGSTYGIFCVNSNLGLNVADIKCGRLCSY